MVLLTCILKFHCILLIASFDRWGQLWPAIQAVGFGPLPGEEVGGMKDIWSTLE